MDKELYEKYKSTQLPSDLTEMFTDLVTSDDAMKKILIHIGQHTTDEEELGITIVQLVERVKLRRKVRVDSNYVYENTNIDRKHAERVVNTLLMMGLCYFRSIPPSKVINYTIRGKQVAAEIKKRQRDN